MTANFGPQTSNAVTTKPDDTAQRYGGQQTWMKDCSGPGASDGTVPDASFYNRIIGALDYITGISGVSALPGDDFALYRAILEIISGNAPQALSTLQELAAALGDDPNFSATLMSMLANRVRVDAPQTLNSTQKSQGQQNLGLAQVAATGQYNNLAGLPTLGTAAQYDVGVAAGSIVQLDSSAKLPAVDGSALTNVYLRGALGAVDLNTVVGPGAYYCLSNTTTNGPTVGGQWYLEVVAYASTGSGYLMQRVTNLSGDPLVYVRTMVGTVWGTWRRVIELDSTGKLPVVDGSQLTGFGTASKLNVGVAASNVVQLDPTTGKLPAVDGSLLTNLTVPAGALTHFNNTATANANVTSSAVNILGVAQGSAGTWLVTCTVNFASTSSGSLFMNILAGASTVIASGVSSFTAGGVQSYTLTGIATSPAGNLQLQISSSVAGTVFFNESGGGKDSMLTAIRIG